MPQDKSVGGLEKLEHEFTECGVGDGTSQEENLADRKFPSSPV